MPRYTLPKNAGVFRVQKAMAGNYIVINNKTGKNQVIIPCQDKKHADDLCGQLNKGEHRGQLWT